jgi:hypothetical protein
MSGMETGEQCVEIAAGRVHAVRIRTGRMRARDSGERRRNIVGSVVAGGRAAGGAR